jgi:hypothetical protein
MRFNATVSDFGCLNSDKAGGVQFQFMIVASGFGHDPKMSEF